MSRLTEWDAVENTLTEIRAAKERLEKQYIDMQRQITKQAELLAFWECRLAELGNGAGSQRQRRLRRGEPLRLIRQLYHDSGPAKGFAITDLAEKLGIGWSTVRSVLTKHPKIFVERQGHWSLL